GAGQGDTAIRDLADTVVLLLQPETGDDLQWEKAGLLEVADVVVIHKADLSGADRVEAQVRASLGPAFAIVRVSSKTATGSDELWKMLETVPNRSRHALGHGRYLLRLAQDLLAVRFTDAATTQAPDFLKLLSQRQQGPVEALTAAQSLLRYLATQESSK